jgi:all-trans-retinol dehydrogenase (NAD+)
MASAALSAAIWAATEPLVTAPLLYILTRGPPHLREHLLAPFDNNALATNGVARVAALVTALKVLTSLGVVKRIDAALTRLALNNWRFGRAGKEWKFGPQKEEVVVITGASSGIGAEMVKEFAPMARVIAIDVQDFPEELGNLPDVTFYHCDITDLDAVHETCKQIRTRHGDPSVLINNAGVAAPGPSILESTNAGTERVIKVNLLSHFTLIREFLPGMLHQRKGQ